MAWASLEETAPLRAISKDCSRQSSRERRTVEATRRALDCQSASATSVADRGAADVTAAATRSAPSSHSTRMGRLLEAVPCVKGMSATQNSPGWTGIVQAFVLGNVTAQKCGVIAQRGGPLLRGLLDGNQPAARSNALHQRRRKLKSFARLKLDFVSHLDCNHALYPRFGPETRHDLL